MRGKWLLVSLMTEPTHLTHLLKDMGFKYAPTKAIVDYLERNGFATVKRGRQYKNNPARTRVYPNPELASALVGFHLQTVTDIEPPYVVINEPEGKWKEVLAELPIDHPDRLEMTQINDFLKGHHMGLQRTCAAEVQARCVQLRSALHRLPRATRPKSQDQDQHAH